MPQPIGVPVKLIHESEGFIVTVELINGEVYRGLMVDAEDNMNCQLQNVTLTARDGKQSKLEHVYIRGSKIRLIILPDMLKNAPMFARFNPKNKSKVGEGTCGRCGAAGQRGRSCAARTDLRPVGAGLGIGRGVAAQKYVLVAFDRAGHGGDASPHACGLRCAARRAVDVAVGVACFLENPGASGGLPSPVAQQMCGGTVFRLVIYCSDDRSTDGLAAAPSLQAYTCAFSSQIAATLPNPSARRGRCRLHRACGGRCYGAAGPL
jgi:small nuclear ribonucleoprotein D3